MTAMAQDFQLTKIWQPFDDTSQERFLACNVREILFGGTRGPGKTDAALMKFHKYTGRGFGNKWRGIVFSTRYKNLDDIVAKGKQWLIQTGVRFISSKDAYKFVWPDGEELLLRVLEKDDDYWNYHGHQYPFVWFEELTKWATKSLYDAIKSINRCPWPEVPKFYISTTNPYGPGHHWVKEYWIDPNPQLTSYGALLPPTVGSDVPRVRFDGDIMENKFLVKHDPEYIKQLDSIENEALRKAWRYGDWDVNVGAFFHGYLTQERNMIKPFMPPAAWPRWKAYDWGSRRPFSIGYYAINPEGIIHRYREIYGWNGTPNEGLKLTYRETADLMTQAEKLEVKSGLKFKNNPADDSIFSNDGREKSLAEEFHKLGHTWQPARKNLWGRVRRWELMKDLFKTGSLLITSDCTQFWRVIPNLQHDEKNWEDIDTDLEDHIADETGYAVMSRHMARVLKKDFKTKQDTTTLAPQTNKFSHLIGERHDH